jgi:hypothetical protein
MKITFKDDLGDKYDIPADQAAEAEAAGLVPLTQDEITEEVNEEKYGNQTAKALLYSGARGLTLGLSDQLLAKTGIVDEEELKQIKERNQSASLGGEIAGAVVPALFTGGTSVAARVAAATPSGFAAKLAARSGSKVAEEVAKRVIGNGVKQSVIKKAAELGTAGLVEGALFGEAQLVTEEALGDNEFTAESILASAGTGAIFGGVAGAGIGAMGGVAERALKKIDKSYKLRSLKNRTDLPESDKAQIAKQIIAEDEMLNTVNLNQRQGVAEAVDRLVKETGLEATPTPGMLQAEPLVGRLESSIGGGASPYSVGITAQREAIEDVIQEGIKKPLGAGEVSRFDAGDAIKQGLRDQVKADLGDAPMVFQSTLETYGKMEPNKRTMKLVPSRIAKSDSYQVLLKSERGAVDEMMGMLTNAKNLTQVNQIKKVIGQRLAEANRQGQRTLADAMGDLYRTAGRAEEDAIEFAAKQAFGKDDKAVAEWMKGWTQAKKTYTEAYKKYGPIAEELGIRAKSMQGIADQIADIPAEKLAKKFLDVNDYKTAMEMAEQFPDAFDIARRQRLTELLKATKDKEGKILLGSFAKKIQKMEETQKKILFGNKYQGVIDDVITAINSLPPNINPSGTDFANAFRSILSPIYQATEFARFALYKGGSASLNKYFKRGLPTMAAAEAVQNNAKQKIQSATKGFFSAPRRATSYTAASMMSEAQVKRAKESIEKLQTEPEEWLNDYLRKNKDFTSFMPKSSAALQNRMMAASSFLMNKFPQRQEQYLNDDYTPPKSEVIKFNDYLMAIEKPFKVIEQLKEGYLNPRAMEAMKVVYPRMFAELQQGLVKNMPKKLTPTQRAQMSQILGAKVSPIADFNRMKLLQSSTQPQQPQAQMSLGGAKNLNVADRAQTTLDKTLYRS